MTKAQAITRAQQIADKNGEPIAVMNFNPFSSNEFVLRTWDDRLVGHRDLVCKINSIRVEA